MLFRSLVFFIARKVCACCPPVGHSAPVAQLDLPARDICQNEDISPAYKGSAHTVDQHDAGLDILDSAAGFFQVLSRIKIFQTLGGHDAEYRVVRQFTRNHRVDICGRHCEVVAVYESADIEWVKQCF